MKDPQEVLQLVPKIPRRLTVFVGGGWNFVAPPAKFTLKRYELEYYKMGSKFGISDEFETDPRKTLGRGEVEDYLIINTTYNVYSIMTKEKFKVLNPPKIVGTSSYKMRTSKDLAQPGFLEGIIEGYNQESSNIPTGGSPPSTGGGSSPSTGGGGAPSTGGGGY